MATEKVDTILWKVLESVAFSSIPRAKFSSENENPHYISIPGIEDNSYQEWVVRQPIKMGGFGLRCQVNTSPAAFVRAVEQILPSFGGASGVCPQLAHLLDSMDDSWRQVAEQDRSFLMLGLLCKMRRGI